MAALTANTTVHIYNALGELVYSGITDSSGKVVLNSLTTGIYVASVQAEASVSSVRFVVN